MTRDYEIYGFQEIPLTKGVPNSLRLFDMGGREASYDEMKEMFYDIDKKCQDLFMRVTMKRMKVSCFIDLGGKFKATRFRLS